ncbi:DUF6199 family natural product biosynthesis protein [Cohnella xylanilytica]|uniref:DUF6199 family natural product biosynthesis protein n=1 Tax=Cohnella xylanilytica TaxID=557555 RepID=UPI001BB334E7|nr:DUF6199 family natural product biosynthesis protein [Cohnella xylanilytica]
MAALSVLLMLAGLFLLTKPAVWWKITEVWKSNDATEPSDLYLWNTRIGGALCLLAGGGSFLVLAIL